MLYINNIDQSQDKILMSKKTIGNHSEDSNAGNQTLRSYQPPAILSRERLESAANVCSGTGFKSTLGEPNGFPLECGTIGLNS